jgi:hypothetical protein
MQAAPQNKNCIAGYCCVPVAAVSLFMLSHRKRGPFAPQANQVDDGTVGDMFFLAAKLDSSC